MKPVCWQNSVVIFEKSYLPHMTSFLAEIWSVDRSLNFEWPTINTGRMRDLTLQDVISMIFLFLFFLHYISRKVWMLAF
jgi:hypothetical protein